MQQTRMAMLRSTPKYRMVCRHARGGSATRGLATPSRPTRASGTRLTRYLLAYRRGVTSTSTRQARGTHNDESDDLRSAKGHNPMHRYLFCLLCFLCSATHAQTDPVGNWFHDPFFQIAAQIAACPTPAGPAIALSQMREQAHQRIERGTSCWLAHTCDKPNAYAYDAEIAGAISALVAAQPQLLSGSLWITVQRRIVWLDGCMAPDATPAALAAAMKALPNVETVVVRTSTLAR